jgi:hypothetical protein
VGVSRMYHIQHIGKSEVPRMPEFIFGAGTVIGLFKDHVSTQRAKSIMRYDRKKRSRPLALL